jgi:hypothetical protein
MLLITTALYIATFICVFKLSDYQREMHYTERYLVFVLSLDKNNLIALSSILSNDVISLKFNNLFLAFIFE